MNRSLGKWVFSSEHTSRLMAGIDRHQDVIEHGKGEVFAELVPFFISAR